VSESYKIRKTDPDEYSEIEKIFEAQGLENNKNGVTILKGYAVEVFDRLIGGAEVMLQEGEYTFSVAIDSPFKGRGIGKSLFQMVKKEIRSLGAKRIMIQAKTPEYWENFGFMEVVNLNSVPETFRCDDCSQYGIDCFPKIMILNL
jgi:N-acetylglutamate synthase-like GNAT family acetyltransferase